MTTYYQPPGTGDKPDLTLEESLNLFERWVNTLWGSDGVQAYDYASNALKVIREHLEQVESLKERNDSYEKVLKDFIEAMVWEYGGEPCGLDQAYHDAKKLFEVDNGN